MTRVNARLLRGGSVRARLTVVATAVIFAALAVAGIALVVVVTRSTQHAVDSSATEHARAIAAAVSTQTGDGLDQVTEVDQPSDGVIQVVDRAGRVVLASPNVRNLPRLFAFPAAERVRVHGVATRLPIPDTADSYRVAVAEAGQGRIVYAAVAGDDVRETTRLLALSLLGGVPLLTALFAVLTSFLVARALRPAELAAARERAFLSDAAHELRSPLTALQAELEAASIGRGTPDAASVLAEVSRLSRLVDNLLHLARLDATRTGQWREVDLDDVVFAEVERARATTATRFDVGSVGAARIRGDAPALAQLVRNLLDNAARHARSNVEVALSVEDGHAVLRVADDGPGIAREDRERVFQRFVRLDGARSRQDGGFGLGLAIVRDVARVHGGSVVIGDRSPGAEILVHVPLAARREEQPVSPTTSGAAGR